MVTVSLRPDLAIRQLSDDSILLLTETDRIVLCGGVYVKLMAALALGNRSRIIEQVSQFYSADHVHAAIADLESRRLLVSGQHSLPAHEAAFWESCGISSSLAESRLLRASVSVEAECSVGLQDLVDALKVMHVQLTDNASFHMVMVNDYLQSTVTEVNRQHLQDRHSWMLVKPSGRHIWLGPILIPGKTACYQCLRLRLMENRWTDLPIWMQGGQLPTPSPLGLPTTFGVAAQLATIEAAKFLVLENSALVGTIQILDTLTLELGFHPVVRRSDCAECCRLGRPRLWMSSETLGHSSMPELLSRHLSPTTGILRGLEELTDSIDSPVRILGIQYTLPIPAYSSEEVSGPQLAIGRGFSESEAETSCVAEAIERRSLYFRGDESTVRIRYVDTAGVAIHPNSLTMVSDRQYKAREELNAVLSSDHWIPEPFDEYQEIDWTPVCNLASGRIRLVPTSYCYLRHVESEFCVANSAGCAAGGTRKEAILSGLYELVEREAASLWWYNRVARPSVRIESFRDPAQLQIAHYLASKGLEFKIIDLTTDWQIPAFAALCYASDGTVVHYAFGCHSSAKRAARQASTELFQVMLARKQDGLVSTMSDYPFLEPSGTCEAPIQTSDEPPAKLLEVVSRRATALNLGIFVLDLTRADTQVPVVRVIVPGMRPTAPRLAPGRLYDVPIKLQWRAEAATEEEMNPVQLCL